MLFRSTTTTTTLNPNTTSTTTTTTTSTTSTTTTSTTSTTSTTTTPCPQGKISSYVLNFSTCYTCSFECSIQGSIDEVTIFSTEQLCNAQAYLNNSGIPSCTTTTSTTSTTTTTTQKPNLTTTTTTISPNTIVTGKQIGRAHV